MTARVVTDLPDYAPGSTAQITAWNDEAEGSNFNIGETLKFQVTRTDGIEDFPSGNLPWFATDGGTGDADGVANGSIGTSWFVENQYAYTSLKLTATGVDSGAEATTHFTDAPTNVDNVEGWETLVGVGAWGGNLQGSNPRFNECDVIPFRIVIKNATAGAKSVDLKYDFTNSQGEHFIDSLASYNATFAGVDPTVGTSPFGVASNWATPTDGSLPSAAQVAGSITTYGLTGLTFSAYSFASNQKSITLSFNVPTAAAGSDVILLYGGHLERFLFD
ncbi:hypothetical protein EP7_001959 [Isosphaeraceae bacterium EP7]